MHLKMRSVIAAMTILLAISCMSVASEPVKAYRDLVFGESRRETDRKTTADKALMEAETLRSIIETQYGPPHGVDDIRLLSTKDGKVTFRYYWEIDNVKAILIGVAARQFRYWAEMSICYIPIMAEVSARADQQESDAVIDSAGDFRGGFQSRLT